MESMKYSISSRPIVSSIGTYNYQLAKFLRELVSPLIPSEFCTKDSFTFSKEINQASLHKHFLVSYDIISLYTKIPLQETIDVAVNSIRNNKVNFKISKSDFKKLFNFSTSQTHFLFKGQIYDQTDGVAMSSPLAPVRANLFMGNFEDKWLKSFNGEKPAFYKRYTDDIFAAFTSENHADLFLEYINNKHNSITKLLLLNQLKISFLDLTLNKTSSSTITN
ncbi:uncharacterized protein LOC136081502 [Hydra vulgaris]|uniref:Uncharacterized protein LOC136081502 n=1 Tax=Hydra vulgaris TaxID=6087 RepID=A0ABM4C039_HYDVU